MLQAQNNTAIICRRKPKVSVGRLLSILRMRIIAQNTKVSRSNKTAIIYPRKPKVSMGQLLSILQIRIIAQDTKVSRSNKIPTIPFGTKRSEQASVPNSCSKNAEQFRNGVCSEHKIPGACSGATSSRGVQFNQCNYY